MNAETLRVAAATALAEAERLDSPACLAMAALFERADEGWPSYKHTSIGRLVGDLAAAYLGES